MKKKKKKKRTVSMEDFVSVQPMKKDVGEGVFEVHHDKKSRRTDDDFEKMFAQSQTCMDAIDKDFKKGRKHDETHEIECPICGEPAKYGVSSYNGHRWYNCTGEGCVSFRE